MDERRKEKMITDKTQKSKETKRGKYSSKCIYQNETNSQKRTIHSCRSKARQKL